jgi:hypothetical protein
MSQIRQGALHAAVSPGRILFSHANDELLNLLGDAGSARVLTVLAAVKLPGDESLVPSHEGVGCGERGELFEAPAAKRVSKRSETTALGVSEPEPSAAELGFEDLILFSKVGDHLLLVPIDPAGDHGDQDVQDYGLSSG